ncbi:hypothetical protein R1sor_010809 [Riccia sorocarpa]|uniref:Uroporphyrinogen decarboxylase n=1 Tax=Riccia sorocarpa TaxID=122646 RepID=A0ABD3HZ42_9MARC
MAAIGAAKLLATPGSLHSSFVQRDYSAGSELCSPGVVRIQTRPKWRESIVCMHLNNVPAKKMQEPQVESPKDPLLLRVARGEDAERTPVWLMRQAGRYMAEFRKYSQKYPFRLRSETPEIAIELSLQPWRAFQTDGVIMFSDILTPLPALGIEFDMVPGKGPVISTPVRSFDDLRSLRSMDDPDKELPFIREILSTLRAEINGESTILGFVGTPWTLAAYAMEGSANKNLLVTKSIMQNDPAILETFLDHLSEALVVYICHQIDCGAQVVQLFDSWAHHLSPQQFRRFSLPYAEKVIRRVKERYPETPLIFHANGGTGKLHLLAEGCNADVIGLDWSTEMQEARKTFGTNRVLQGNVDPMVLFGSEEVIRREVERCITEAGRSQHILNVGHGVVQGTPEEAVRLFCQLARESGNCQTSSEPKQKQVVGV